MPGQRIQPGTHAGLPALLKVLSAPYYLGLGREMNCLGKGSRVLFRFCLDCSWRSSLLLTNLCWKGGTDEGVYSIVQDLPRLLCKAFIAPYQHGLGKVVNYLGKGSSVPCSTYLHCSIRYPCSKPTWVREGGEVPGQGVQRAMQYLPVLLHKVPLLLLLSNLG